MLVRVIAVAVRAMRVMGKVIGRGRRRLRVGLRRNHVHFGSGQAAAAHSARLNPRANIERRRSILKHLERHARIHQRAKQHVAADSGKTLQVTDPHRFQILIGRGYAPRLARISAGRMAFIEPERKPVQSSVT